MIRLKKFISVVLSISLLLSAAAIEFSLNVSAATVKVAYINGSGVNVRKSASTSSAKVATVSYREVTVTGTSGSWLKVTYTVGGKKINGYIYNDSDYVYVTSYNPDASFKAQLENFPESYREALTELHKKYPDWNFIPDYVNMSFEDAVKLQMNDMQKQVSSTGHKISWRSMGKGSYDWSTGKWEFTNGGWTGASREVISYYMDPRNFLNSTEIYMFLKQGYDYGSYTEAGLKKVVAGTFLEKGYSDPKNTEGYDGSYIKIIMEAGEQSGVSPYIIASAIIQEQGSAGSSSLISGTYSKYKGYYNFFNYGASGNTTTAVIENGLKYAKNEGWNSRSAAIIGGAKEFIKGYIEIGQDTYFYQDFNVNFSGSIWHQYAQAVHDARSKGYSLNKVYASDTDSKLTFRIPVYTSMPLEASEKPAANSKRNNYYFNDISVRGLTPSFSRYTYSYDLQVTSDTIIDVSYPSTASLACDTEFALKKGTNHIVLSVKSQTGYTNDYKITVEATKKCTLYINTGGTVDSGDDDKKENSVKKGDINGDGKISASDMANIRLHLLNKYLLKGDNFTAADVNGDGKISASDMANVRLHLLGKYTIK